MHYPLHSWFNLYTAYSYSIYFAHVHGLVGFRSVEFHSFVPLSWWIYIFSICRFILTVSFNLSVPLIYIHCFCFALPQFSSFYIGISLIKRLWHQYVYLIFIDSFWLTTCCVWFSLADTLYHLTYFVMS